MDMKKLMNDFERKKGPYYEQLLEEEEKQLEEIQRKQEAGESDDRRQPG